MRHHYWEWPIPTYLFLGGLGGGIFCLSAILALIMYPSVAVVAEILAWPGFIAVCCLGLGCVFLIVDLGQPMVFYRAFIKSTSVLAWGARMLTICAIFGVLWFASYIPWEWFKPIADALVFFRPLLLGIAGVSGLGIMLYTGVFLSTLKAHAFWATPALPVLFTVSALSTACAAISLSMGWWPAQIPTAVYDMDSYAMAYLYVSAMEVCHEVLHVVDMILVVVEIIVLLVMVLSFLGAGNKTANRVAHKWVHGAYAGYFWIGMIAIGLVIPEFLYIFTAGSLGSTIIAPVMVLIGGLLLRFMVVNSDERAPLPGENLYYGRLVGDDAEFIHRWVYGENEY